MNGGEFLVKAGARVKSGVLARARRVVVTGPARGRLPGSASGTAAASGLADLPSSYALRFDGQTGAVELPFGYRGTHPLTIEAWVTVESLSGTDNLTIVSDVDNTGITLFVSSKGHVFFGPAGGTPLAISESPLPLGKRVHIAAVFDRPHVRLYVNGRLAGTAEVPDYRESPLRLVIGANPNNPGYSEHFHGQIDEVHFSNVARYEEDFDPQNRFFADDATLALYHCEDDSGDVVRDASRNGLNGRWIQRPAD